MGSSRVAPSIVGHRTEMMLSDPQEWEGLRCASKLEPVSGCSIRFRSSPRDLESRARAALLGWRVFGMAELESLGWSSGRGDGGRRRCAIPSSGRKPHPRSFFVSRARAKTCYFMITIVATGSTSLPQHAEGQTFTSMQWGILPFLSSFLTALNSNNSSFKARIDSPSTSQGSDRRNLANA